MYGLTSGIASIMGYRVIGPGFQLSPLILDSPANSDELPLPNEYPQSIVIDPASKYLYVIGSGAGPGTIHEFSIFPDSGKLKSIATVSLQDYPGLGNGMIDPTGRFLFVPSSSERLYAFQINPSNGTLTQTVGSPYLVGPIGSLDPITTSRLVNVAMNGNGSYLFVSACPQYTGDESCALFGYAVDATSGALSPVPGNPYAVDVYFDSGQFTIAPSSDFLYASVYSPITGSTIDSFAIDPNSGSLTGTGTFTGPGASGTLAAPVIDPTGTFMYAYYQDTQSTPATYAYYAFKLDSSTGILNPLPGSSIDIPQSIGKEDVMQTLIVRIP